MIVARSFRCSVMILRECILLRLELGEKDEQFQVLCPLKKKSSSLGPPLLTSFSASCSSKLRKGSLLSGSVCTDAPDVLPAPGVGCWSYGVGILSIGSKWIRWLLSWFWLRFAVRGTGDGARLANCGSGENEKFGEKGRASPPPLALGGFKELLGNGGV